MLSTSVKKLPSLNFHNSVNVPLLMLEVEYAFTLLYFRHWILLLMVKDGLGVGLTVTIVWVESLQPLLDVEYILTV